MDKNHAVESLEVSEPIQYYDGDNQPEVSATVKFYVDLVPCSDKIKIQAIIEELDERGIYVPKNYVEHLLMLFVQTRNWRIKKMGQKGFEFFRRGIGLGLVI